jgi:acyl-coenzyme A synthetase/AMP-(fatty) acid ligase
MVKRAQKGMPYPYLHDPTQVTATAWGAERTPEFFLLNSEGIVVYHGRMDDSPRDPTQATTSELKDAIDAMVSGVTPAVVSTESIGCSVKWK